MKFGFHKNLSEGTAKWKYTKRGCTVFVKLLKEVSAEQNLNQNQETTLALQQISNSLKQKSNEDVCECLTKIISGKITNRGILDVLIMML